MACAAAAGRLSQRPARLPRPAPPRADSRFTLPLPLPEPPPAGEDIEERAALERRFQELCEREAAVMAEMAALREVAVV